jgi:Site-specific recombinase XerD
MERGSPAASLRNRRELENMAENRKKRLPPGITQRKDGRYQARYTFNGKRYTIYGKDLKEVQKKLRDVKYEMDHGIFAKPSKVTVDSWFEVWKEEYAANSMRENTLAHVESMYRYHIKPEIGHMKMQDVRTEHIQMLLNKMKRQEYSSDFMKRVRNVVSQMFKQAYRNDMVMRNPVENAVTPSGKAKKGHRVLTEQEQAVFLEYATESEYELIFILGFSTGMRIGEIQALQWNNIDFKKREISIEGTLVKVDGKEYVKGPAKTKSSIRTVPMLPDVAGKLKEYRKEQLKYRMILGPEWQPVKGLEDLLFCTAIGRPLSRSVLYNAIDRIIERINHDERMKAREECREPAVFEHFSSHTMRHTFATRALENGIPPKVVQELLGHSTIKTTMDIYTHVLPKTKNEEIQKIANLF